MSFPSASLGAAERTTELGEGTRLKPRVAHASSDKRLHGASVVIAGGGIAGVEALLALHDLAGHRADLTLVAPQADFVYKPLLVEEPFNHTPPVRHPLVPLAERNDAGFRQGAIQAVRPSEHAIELDDGSSLEYDFLLVCVGGRFAPAFDDVVTFPSPSEPLDADRLLENARRGTNRIAFVVPAGVTWSLPLYELALMTARRSAELGAGIKLAIITPEPSPLAAFGSKPSAAVSELLRARQIQLFPRSVVREIDPRGIRLSPNDRVLGPAEVVALPQMSGPALAGLPSDDQGFIPVDDHGRVRGVDDVYAAGDGTNFPVKQGGLGAQQADAAAAHLAHHIGAPGAPEPFTPVLRGKLLTGDSPVHLSAKVAGGGGEGETSADGLWWPPHNVSARYLAPLLHHSAASDPNPPGRSVEVDVALPRDWYKQPRALDPLWPPRTG